MQFTNGTEYASNYARASAYFRSTCAPAPTDSESSAAYSLITGIYDMISENPTILGIKTVAQDVHFAPFETQKGREMDTKIIRDPIKRIDTLMRELYDAVDTAIICESGLLLDKSKKSPSKALTNVLAAQKVLVKKSEDSIVFEMDSTTAAGLSRLCTITKNSAGEITDNRYLFFSRCVFDPNSNWLEQAFDTLLCADGALLMLCNELEKRGYTRIVCRDGERPKIDYFFQYGKKAEPLKMAWGEKTHSGIEVTYEELRLEPCFLWLRMPMFRTVLSHIDELPKNVQSFISDYTKSCDGCGYCIQTDKTGTRPRAAMSVLGTEKCPNFPGYSMNWRRLNPEIAREILDTLDALGIILLNVK